VPVLSPFASRPLLLAIHRHLSIFSLQAPSFISQFLYSNNVHTMVRKPESLLEHCGDDMCKVCTFTPASHSSLQILYSYHKSPIHAITHRAARVYVNPKHYEHRHDNHITYILINSRITYCVCIEEKKNYCYTIKQGKKEESKKVKRQSCVRTWFHSIA
jgi:hypothetical protein